MAKLLVVDDEKNLRLVVQKEMTRQGHDVETASDGEAAWEILEARDFDVLLCDINMPRLDGFGFIEKARELPAHRATPILVLSTESSDEKKARARTAGASGWIVKPFNSETLLRAVRRVTTG